MRIPTSRIEKLKWGSSSAGAPNTQETALFIQVDTGANSQQSNWEIEGTPVEPEHRTHKKQHCLLR
jgi:hypothetical protein